MDKKKRERIKETYHLCEWPPEIIAVKFKVPYEDILRILKLKKGE